MSDRLPRVTAAQTLRALHKIGWEDVRQSGSHVQLRHPFRSGRVTVPNHANAILHPKTLRSILAQAGMSAEEFKELL